MDIYSEIILDHYKNPRKKGRLPGATCTAEDANPLCGDKIRFLLKIGKSGKITDVRFSGSGCAISQASASMLAEEVAGKSIRAVAKWDKEKVFGLLGVTLTPSRTRCALLGLGVLKNALLAYEDGKKTALVSGKRTAAELNKKKDLKPAAAPIFNEKNPFYGILNAVIDPDTQIGLADMGLIYDVVKEGKTVNVTMTLTSMGCPAGPQFTNEIDRLLRRQKGVKDVQIKIVWEPVWTPERMKPELRAVLGF